VKTIHVVVAVIINERQQVLLALRQQHQHQGGLWEFPGGKVNHDETVYQALHREIKEEVGLKIEGAEPLLVVEHQYDDKTVLLDVWQVDNYFGAASGQEGQQIRWCPIEMIQHYNFPAANQAIVEALQLKQAQ
jgi:8-oxo-dGTP diphosphatase